MYICGLERIRNSHRTLLDKLKGRGTIRITSCDRSAAKTLLRWGVVGTADTPAGQVVWQQAIEVTPVQRRIIRRLIGSRDGSSGIFIGARQHDSVNPLIDCGIITEEWCPAGRKIRLKLPEVGLVVICRNAVHSFRRRLF